MLVNTHKTGSCFVPGDQLASAACQPSDAELVHTSSTLTCGFIWLGMFPGKFAGPEFRTLCRPIMAAPCSPKTQRQVRTKNDVGYFRWLPAGPGRPGDPRCVSIGMFGGMFPMFCILEFIPGIGWLSPAEFGPDKTPGLCRLIDDIEEVERVCR